jgi:hypothetical protein
MVIPSAFFTWLAALVFATPTLSALVARQTVSQTIATASSMTITSAVVTPTSYATTFPKCAGDCSSSLYNGDGYFTACTPGVLDYVECMCIDYTMCDLSQCTAASDTMSLSVWLSGYCRFTSEVATM